MDKVEQQISVKQAMMQIKKGTAVEGMAGQGMVTKLGR